jgi:hypothetical protein
MKQLASFGYSILGGLCIGIGGAGFSFAGKQSVGRRLLYRGPVYTS